MDPGHAEVRSDRALTLYNMGRANEAIAAYEEAVEGDPYDSQLLNDLGLAYQGIGDYQKAIESFLTAIEIDNNLDAQENYAVVIMKLGETARALTLFEKILLVDGRRDRALKYYLECRRKFDQERKLKGR
jgi:tetratricopeptide (TPR) repeat protein